MRDQTRRDLLVTISQAAIGLGLASSIPADPIPLPPGVYLPSTDHLGHALTTSGRFHPIPPECPTDYVSPQTRPYQPLFFSSTEFAVVDRLVQLILGEPSTPDSGAGQDVSREVAEWIDLRASSGAAVREAALRMDPLYRTLAVAHYGAPRVRELETADPASICREGLAWFRETAKSRHDREFMSLEASQQAAMLIAVSNHPSDPHLQNPGTRFFEFLKAETIRGFYTSPTGLKELTFTGNAYYAQSPGCRPK